MIKFLTQLFRRLEDYTTLSVFLRLRRAPATASSCPRVAWRHRVRRGLLRDSGLLHHPLSLLQTLRDRCSRLGGWNRPHGSGSNWGPKLGLFSPISGVSLL